MAAEFNPYHIWLGIPPEEQPANYYRLLGLKLFESSGDVIDNAADRQMAHLRTFQSGKHGELTQRLLNEVAAARVCLLDAKKRAAYDQKIRAMLAAGSPHATSPTPATASGVALLGGASAPSSESAIRRQPPRRPALEPTPGQPVAAPAPLPVAAPMASAAEQWDNVLGDSNAAGARAANKSRTNKRAANNRGLAVGIGVAVLLLAAIGVGVVAMSGGPSDGILVFDWPAAVTNDAVVAVDNNPVPLPAVGPLEYRCPAGSHHIVAERRAYKLDESVSVAAGDKIGVPAAWKPKAVLVLDWPLEERRGAALRIDGRAEPVTQKMPLEIAVAPGRHAIEVSRPAAPPILASASVIPNGRTSLAIVAPPTTAKLVLDWPADQRQNAELTIDGQSQTMPADSGDKPLELTVPPGRHIVRFIRTGFESFSKSIDVAAGAGESIKPVWTPEQKTVAVETPIDTAPKPVKKLSPPPSAEQQRIAKELSELYKTAGPGGKDAAKAQQLYEVAAKDSGSPAERFVLLMKGAEIAAAAGDLSLALSGVDTMDAVFEIDTMPLKEMLLDKFAAAGRPEQLAAALPLAEQLVDQAVAADDYASALVLATAASRVAAKSQLAIRQQIEDRLSRRRHDIRLIEPICAAAKKAQAVLDKNPRDADANFAVGQWRCFYKNDWAAGLPLLARGSDEKLKSLAAADLKSPGNVDEQIQLADAWWQLAEKQAGAARDSIRLHAGGIYQSAMPTVVSALKKSAIEKRLAEIANLAPAQSFAGRQKANDVATDPPPNSGASPDNSAAPPPATTLPSAAGGKEFPLNQWVDLLKLADPASDALWGAWSRKGALVSATGDGSVLELPAAIRGAYELEVVFTRTQGAGDVHVAFPVGDSECDAVLSGAGGAFSALYKIDGHDSNDSPISVHPGTLENDRRYRLLFHVAMAGEHDATVDVALDGKQYLPRWSGEPASLSMDPHWAPMCPQHVCLSQGRCLVTFQAVRLRMESGSAEATPPIDAEMIARRPRIVSAKFGIGTDWLDVTPKVAYCVARGLTIKATPPFFGVDPAPFSRKELRITYEKSARQGNITLDEDSEWSAGQYENLQP